MFTGCDCQFDPYASFREPEGLQLPDNASDITDWLQDEVGTNHLAGVFLRGGQLVYTPRVGEEGYVPPKHGPGHEADDDGEAQVRRLTAGELKARVRKHYRPYVLSRGKKPVPIPVMFPGGPASEVVAAPDLCPNVRRLYKITHTPILRLDGSILDTPGYDDETGFLFLPKVGEHFRSVPDNPSASQLLLARKVIEMLVVDFPWVTPSDRANYIGGPLFTPILRSILLPAYPLFGIRAPMRGSGKTLLGLVARILHSGIIRSEFPHSEEEVHKTITAILSDTTGPVVQFDNVRAPCARARWKAC